MKLRNKKTGEIVENVWWEEKVDELCVGDDKLYFYNSLAELNKEWEDYEEDELLYVISAEHKSGYQCVLKEDYPEICKVAKELGIGFETEKECQKAVEKLKAWKRLKDKCFRFYRWNKCSLLKSLPNTIEFACDDTEMWTWEDIQDDLDLLFGGEE